MFDHTSRYYAIADARYTSSTGQEIIYKRRRFLPQAQDLPFLTNVKVNDGDRLDIIAAKTLGNPLLFWRIADANNGMNPMDLTERPGRILKVANPQVPGE